MAEAAGICNGLLVVRTTEANLALDELVDHHGYPPLLVVWPDRVDFDGSSIMCQALQQRFGGRWNIATATARIGVSPGGPAYPAWWMGEADPDEVIAFITKRLPAP